MDKDKLFNRDFTLVVIGQIISLFGNAIIRLALPLYLLDITGSSAIYGAALACSMIPVILLSPIGGVIADRINRRNIMVALDFSTAAILVVFCIVLKIVNPIPVVIITMMLLYGIYAMYQPAVQSSMPLLESQENLLKANSIINLVNALSSLVGPVVGGMCYGAWGVWTVVLIGAACFTMSAIMEIFIHMPFVKQKQKDSIIAIAKEDLREGLHFAVKEKSVIFKVGLVCAAFNLVLSSMMIVGMPTIIKVNLGLSNKLYSYAQASVGFGSLLGGLLMGVLGKHFSIKSAHKILVWDALCIVPFALGMLMNLDKMIIYGLMLVCCTICLALSMMFTILAMTYLQQITPKHLIGKVIAVVMTLCTLSQPIGQAVYGVVFQVFNSQPAMIIIAGIVLSVVVAIVSRSIFINIEESKTVEIVGNENLA